MLKLSPSSQSFSLRTYAGLKGVSFPSEAWQSLFSSSIKGQTEEAKTTFSQHLEQKPQSQKANQNDFMDHSLV